MKLRCRSRFRDQIRNVRAATKRVKRCPWGIFGPPRRTVSFLLSVQSSKSGIRGRYSYMPLFPPYQAFILPLTSPMQGIHSSPSTLLRAMGALGLESLSLVAVTLLLCTFVVVRRYKRHASNQLPLPPGPRRLPIIGNLLDVPKTMSAVEYAAFTESYGTPPPHSEYPYAQRLS